MSRHWTDTFSFLRGTVYAEDHAFFTLIADELATQGDTHALVLEWNSGEWIQLSMLNWSVAACCYVYKPFPSFLAIGEFGDIFYKYSDNSIESPIEIYGRNIRQNGRIRCVTVIDDEVYVGGMGRQVLRRKLDGKWQAIDADVLIQRPSSQVLGFEAITGFNRNEVYALGWKGEIWRFNGKNWTQIDSPTNNTITAACCTSDGHVVGVGRCGMVLMGRDSRWWLLNHENTIEDFWSVSNFKNNTYLASTRAVYRLKGDGLELVDFGGDLPATCYLLSANKESMLSIGAKDVMQYDGLKWKRID